ncbi:MAG: hypothetical protein ACHP8A_18775 [Terriglobales bacterium]
MAQLQGQLHWFVRVKGCESGVLVPSARKIAQRGYVSKSREFSRDSCERGQREILNDAAVLLKLRNHFLRLARSADGTF